MANEKYIYRNTFRLTNSDIDIAYYEIINRLLNEKHISFNALVKLALVELDKKDSDQKIMNEVNQIINNKFDEILNDDKMKTIIENKSEENDDEIFQEETQNINNDTNFLKSFMENYSYQN